jgi:hypothetical protein
VAARFEARAEGVIMDNTFDVCYSLPGLPACAYADLTISQRFDNDGNLLSIFRSIRVYDHRFKSPLVLAMCFTNAADILAEYNRIMSKFNF